MSFKFNCHKMNQSSHIFCVILVVESTIPTNFVGTRFLKNLWEYEVRKFVATNLWEHILRQICGNSCSYKLCGNSDSQKSVGTAVPTNLWEPLFPQTLWEPLAVPTNFVGTAVPTNLSEQYTFYNLAYSKAIRQAKTRRDQAKNIIKYNTI